MPAASSPDRSAKRAVNLTLSVNTLAAAKALNLNVSSLCDAYLREAVRQEQERRWRAEHVEFVGAYNATVEAEGLPLETWRAF